MNEIYLDNSATTRISPAALARYNEISTEEWGNPSSLHARGVRAARVLSDARTVIRRALDAPDGAVVFTGSGSEANNLAIFGRAHAKERYRRGGRIITTEGEHASVAMPLSALAKEGFEVVTVPTRGGVLDADALAAALNDRTVLVTMMAVNNETGARYDLPAAAAMVHRACPEAVFHVDATQAFLKFPFSARRAGFDMVTVSAHKVEGPKGVGALWVSPAILKNKGLAPLILGGGQEDGLRSGTENLPGIAAFAAAVKEGHAAAPDRAAVMEARQAYLLERLSARADLWEVTVNLPPVRAPHIVSLTMPAIKSETMLHFLSAAGICVSSGSACSSHGRHTASPLSAFGLSDRAVDCTIRVSLSYHTTEEELDVFLDTLARGIATLSRIR